MPRKSGEKPSKRPIASLPEPVPKKKMTNGTANGYAKVAPHSKELLKPSDAHNYTKGQSRTHPPPRFSKQWNINSLGESQEEEEFPVSQKLNGFNSSLPNTKLTDPLSKSSDIEMTTMNGDTVQKHRPPTERMLNGTDETDIIKNSLKPGESPDPLIQSLRDELKQIATKMDYKRRGSKTLTDIG